MRNLSKSDLKNICIFYDRLKFRRSCLFYKLCTFTYVLYLKMYCDCFLIIPLLLLTEISKFILGCVALSTINILNNIIKVSCTTSLSRRPMT